MKNCTIAQILDRGFSSRFIFQTDMKNTDRTAETNSPFTMYLYRIWLKKAVQYKLSLYISHLKTIHRTSFWDIELNMRRSSTTGTVREDGRERVSQPHSYSHLNLPSLWDRTASKPPGKFPAVENRKPSCTGHLACFLHFFEKDQTGRSLLFFLPGEVRYECAELDSSRPTLYRGFS